MTRAKRRNIRRTLLSKLGLDPAYRKIFAIGFNKTATTSINEVLRAAGLLSVHNVEWRDSGRPFYHWRFQGFTDGPPDDFARLDRRFPNSRFILNTRDLIDWLDSRLAHVEVETSRGGVPLMSHWQTPAIAVREWVKERDRHHAAVLRHFRTRPRDLLVVNYIRDADAAGRIAEFAGSIADVGRPHAVSLETHRAGALRHRTLIEDGLRALGIPEDEWRNDLLCPSLGVAGDLPADTRDMAIATP